MHRISVIVVWLLPVLAAAAPATSSPFLPQSFGTWRQVSATATVPDAADAAALHEYGLQQQTEATYASGAERLTVHAWRFADATGAFGAFTFYRRPGMRKAAVGRDGAATDTEYLFWKGTTVAEVHFAHTGPGTGAAVTALAAAIPKIDGSAGIAPSLPSYLPSPELDAASVRYAIGPVAYTQMGGALPVEAIDFGQDAEVVTAHYGTAGKQETLTMLMYPTPQIAGAHLRKIEALPHLPGLAAKRSGPLVAVTTGSMSPEEARGLLNRIHFNDYVTINHPEGYVSEGAKMYRLLMGITVLVVVLAGAALLLGIFLGGGRALVRRLRGKPVSSVAEEEFISLHLGN